MASPGNSLCERYGKWLLLITLVHEGGTKICHDLLYVTRKLSYTKKELYAFLKANETRIKADKYQMHILYPPDRNTDDSKFDIPLYTKIIEGLYGHHYSKLVSDLRKLRNSIFHQGNVEFTKKEFDDLWEKASKILESHGFNMNTVHGLKEAKFSQLQEYGKPILDCIELFLQGNKELLFIFLLHILHFQTFYPCLFLMYLFSCNS